MTVSEYYKKLNSEVNRIFDVSLEDTNTAGITHDLICNLQLWYSLLTKYESSKMLLNAIEALDTSCLQMLQGVYRSSFASIRLSLEMLCGAIYFSAHDIEFKEWSNGNKDLMWSYLLSPDNGILSKRFTDAYFLELKKTSADIHVMTKDLYRDLSEMVHGNNSTWNYDNPSLSYNINLQSNYEKSIKAFAIISNYLLCLRFLNSLSEQDVSQIEPYLIDNVNNFEEIRIKIGGVKSE